MKDFYVYLPSNTDFLHENKASRYVTKLAKELTLGSDWECCLKEIHYPRSWNTRDRDEGNSMRVSEIILISYRKHTNNHHLHGEHHTPVVVVYPLP